MTAASRSGGDRRTDRRDGPERSCVVTREVKSPEDLIRFVAAPDGTLTPDLKRKLPGRGVWTSVDAGIVALAIKRKAFERGLKTKVSVPPDLVAMIDELMKRDAVQALAMANKAGLVVAGFGKVEALIGSGRCRAVIAASDGAEDGKRKIRTGAASHCGGCRERGPWSALDPRRDAIRGGGFGIGLGAPTCDTCGACSGTGG